MSKHASRLHSALKLVVHTEKTVALQADKIICVEVDKNTNKVEVAQAVQTLWNLDVVSVNIVNVKGKTKNRGNRKGRRSDVKKAYIRLSADTNLEAADNGAE